MNMHLIDWAIVAGMLVVLLVAALRTSRYTNSVSAFLSANRCGGRYLIFMANAMAGLGVISLVYWFEMYYENGYTAYWWGAMTEPALVVLALSGWVVYRFRQTRAMTLAQFFEMRYSRRFRVFSGLVAYLAGIINFGIFPAVGARFFMALCGLPETFALGGLNVSTFTALMVGLLSISILFTFLGGLIAVMVTDFLQGVFANVVFISVIIFLLYTFGWDRMSEAMLMAPAEKSLVHPFHIGDQTHFNIWFYVISVVIVFYGVLGWQGTQGYNCCAKDAHETKMAGILNGWRFRVLLLVALVVPIAVRTLMHHPDFADQAAAVQSSIDAIQVGDDQEIATLQHQLRTPHALAVMLPPGLLGLMCAAMLAAFISTHDSYLHSWGTIFVQDVMLPFRRKPLSPRHHLWLLRASIFGVAVFIFLFSLIFRQTQYIAMFCAVTASIFVGGAGSVIIGGLYWSRGSTAGAWAAMLGGMGLSLFGILVKQSDRFIMEALDAMGMAADGGLRGAVQFLSRDISGQEWSFIAIAGAFAAYVLVSLLGPRHDHDLDELLHRGRFAIEGETSTSLRDARTWLERLGVDREFTGRDRIVTYVTVALPLIWTVVFVAGTAFALYRKAAGHETSNEGWLSFWHGYTWTILATSIAVTIWFTIGGFKDLRYLFRHLRSRENLEEDGRVEDHHNVSE